MERQFDPNEYRPRNDALTRLGRRMVLPLFQGGLAVILGVSARNGDQSARMKIESAGAQNQRMGRSPWWLALSRRIAGM